MAGTLRIFLADDHAIVREGLRALVASQPDMEVVGEASNGLDALTGAASTNPDIVVLDVSMPGLDGMRATQQLLQVAPHVKVITLTVHEDRGYLQQALDIGASGYVLKRAAANDLITAIRSVSAGGTYIDPAIAGKLAHRGEQADEPLAVVGAESLSEREEEVLRLIANGYSNKEIASRLEISVKSVETYKARSLEKLGLRSRVDIVRFAVGRGWLTGAS